MQEIDEDTLKRADKIVIDHHAGALAEATGAETISRLAAALESFEAFFG